MIDLHIHTKYSHDSKESQENICEAAIRQGLTHIAFTDHVDIGPCYVSDTYERIAACMAEAEEMKARYAGKIEILKGVEMAETRYDRALAARILSICDYDVILGSVHYVPYQNTELAYSQIDFSVMKQEQIFDFFKLYFAEIAQLLETDDIDVLTHLTCPIRYINGKYGCTFDLSVFYPQITAILKRVIQKGVALEVNTSGVDGPLAACMPDRDILALYRDLGGKKITLGSDAHTASRVGLGIAQAAQMARALGFDHCLGFKNRKAFSMPL